MASSFFLNSSTIGVDLNNGNATALFTVGTHVLGSSDTEWVYVQAGTSINGNSVCAFNSGTFTCSMASAGDTGIPGLQVCVSQTSISAQAFGWVAIRGVGLSVAVQGTTTLTGVMYIGGTAAGSGKGDTTTGCFTNNITASGTVFGCVIISTTQSATATGSGFNLGNFNLNFPRTNAAGMA